MSEYLWWQKAVFYQIYPRSFADGNGDGIGDLEGMIKKLDYLQDLGVDAIWLSPHFPSPQVDWGYDVSDYCGVAPEYGTLDQFKTYLDAVHQRGMHLILDLVLNHTSDQHPWFIESRSSKQNPKRDWYVWREGKNGKPPNNWYSTFGGSGWEYDSQTDEWYYHFFFKEQPDLNWRNPEVKQAMFDVVRFWFDMGVDGFRLDAVGTIYEHPEMPDYQQLIDLNDLYRMERMAKESEQQQVIAVRKETVFHYQHDLPEVHDLMKELRAVVDKYPNRVLVGETDDISFYGNGDDELHLIFNFPLMRKGHITPALVRENQQERLTKLPNGSWPCNTLGNHDSPRMYTHFSENHHAGAVTRLNLALLLTLWGTPFLYNGEEIGMSDYCIEQLETFRDPLSLYAYRLEREVMESTHAEAMEHAVARGRDRCRTPLQWENSPHAGFCPADVRPWLPVNPNFSEGVNVADQLQDSNSLWRFYQKLLQVRKQNRALQVGQYQPLHPSATAYLSYLRKDGSQTCLVVLNYSDTQQQVNMGAQMKLVKTLFSTHQAPGTKLDADKLRMEPFEVYIGESIE